MPPPRPLPPDRTPRVTDGSQPRRFVSPRRVVLPRRIVLPRRAASLLEVAIASMMMAMLLVPSIKLVAQSDAMHRRLTDRDELLLHARSVADEFRFEVRDPVQFDRRQNRTLAVRNVDSDTLERVRARITTSSDLSGQLMRVNIQTWSERGGNRRPDPGEPSVTLDTQIARHSP